MLIIVQYKQLVLSMEDNLEDQISKAEDPLLQSLLYARTGNYIDFGALGSIDSEKFIQLLSDNSQIASEQDLLVYKSFCRACESAKSFLLLSDNCGEIVLDKLMLRQLKSRYPNLKVTVMVRGSEVLNDATLQDAAFVGLSDVAEIISNGSGIGGTIPQLLSEQAKTCLDQADVILSKGQGNYESLSGQGYHVFYSFLCKCELFTKRFNVPALTGMFIEE